MRALSIFTGCLLATVLAPGAAHADSVQATRFEMTEKDHIVDMKVDRGFATLVIRRTVTNLGPKSDQATFMLNLPNLAVATRLRTSGVDAKGQGVWFEGELMEAEAAAKKYQELTGIGGYYPKDPALLSWRRPGLLALQVFPVLGQSSKTVEYTLKMPLTYEHGAYHMELPPMGTDALTASVRISATHPEDGLVVNGIAPAGSGGGGITARAEKPIMIELHPRNVSPVDAVIASVAVAADKHLVRGRIAAAPHVGEVPLGAHVVVLFDGSRSHHDFEGGLAAVRAYLGHMKGATVDFITFDRETRQPLGAALPVATALSKLASFQLVPRNGSRIDDALARADTILQASSSQARRVVVVTDTLTRSELTPQKIGASAWKSGAVVHFAVVTHGAPSLTRDDDSDWATLPRRTGGLYWAAAATGTVDTATRTVFEEWARPKRIDKLEVTGVSGNFYAPSVLDEGQGLEHFTIADTATSQVQIKGELWSKPLRVAVTPSAEHGKLTAALVFGSDLYTSFSEPEQMKLALLGRAVTPVTSYLAIEPGVRPSNEGLEWDEVASLGSGGGGRGEGIGLGGIGTLGHGAGPTRDAWLTGELVAIAKTCAPSAKAVTAELESTLEEIVDVKAVVLSPTRDAKAEVCVREGIWKLSLPAATFNRSFESHTVTTKL